MFVGAYFDVSLNIIVRWGVKDQELHSGIFDDRRMVHESRLLRLRIGCHVIEGRKRRFMRGRTQFDFNTRFLPCGDAVLGRGPSPL